MEKHRIVALLTLVTLLVAPLSGAGRVLAEQPPLFGDGTVGAEAGVNGDWWAAVQDEIRRSEYDITWQEETLLPGMAAAYQAPNRAHNLRTYFTPGGVVVVPRTWEGDETPPWRLGLRLAGWGSPGAAQPTGTPILHPAGNRMEYRYPAQPVVEWYVNDERGLEQGFTLTGPPASLSPDGREGQVVLDLALTGDLGPRLGPAGRSVEYTTSAGVPVLSYAGLHVYDAGGRFLPAHLALPSPGVVRVVIDVSSALYPITVDPLLSAPPWRTEGNQENAQWGSSVAFAGDLNGDGYDDLAIGAPYFDDGYDDRGELFLFYGSAAGTSTSFDARIAGPSEGALLGEVVGPAGDVNNDGYDDLIASAPGDAYVAVYYGSETGVSGRWTATGVSVIDHFGGAAGTAGDVNGDGFDDVIVGAMNADSMAAGSGAVYVWLGSSTGLGSPGLPGNADWSATSAQGGAHFGRSAGSAGDLNGDGYGDIVVGANAYDNPESDEGAIFVWYGSSSGLGSPGLPSNADWSAQGNQDNAFLGTSAGSAGDVNGDGYDDLIAGAYRYSGGLANAGRAYVFYGSGTGLACGSGCPVNANTAANWTADGVYEGAFLGAASATAGDVDGDGYDEVLIGAPYDDSGQENAGRAYLYRGSVTGLGTQASWSGGGGQQGELYGWSVAGAGDVNGDGCDELLVGAPLYDRDQADEGSAYLYYGSPLALLTQAAWSSLGGQKGAHLGAAVDTAGDLNGDGFSDVVVGVPNLDNTTGGGRVLVYYGGPAGLPGTASWTATGDQGLAEFGGAVATAGDLNGDGYADLAIGAPGYDPVGLPDAGAAFVYLGTAGGLGDPGTPSNADWAVYGDEAGARLGSDLGTAGDVNRDGYDDLIAGAPLHAADWGRAYVYHGSVDPDPTADWQCDGPLPGGNFGFAVDTAGDVNRDGYADVIVGAPQAAAVYVFYGSSGGLGADFSWQSVNTQPDSRAGHAVATAGDTNGDGYSDILIGAPDYDSNGMDRGRVYLCFGSSALPTCTWLFDGSQPGGRFGRTVSTAGDVDGDGYADVVAGEPLADDHGRDAGQALVFYGAGSPAMGHGWAVGGRANALLGGAVGTAGDVNGDGYADVIVGSSNYSDTQMQEGQAAVYYGAAAGPSAVPQWTAQSTQADTLFGLAVDTAGDVNGDGYADVIVGAPYYDGGETNEGAAFVYHGAAAGPGAIASWAGESNQAGAEFGAAVGAAGDVNGDGYGDIVVGAWHYDSAGTDDGGAFAWYGSQSGLGDDGTPDNADWQFGGIYSSSHLGTVVGTAGDVNGDGFSDVIVSAPGFESTLQDQGRAAVFHGSAAGLSGVVWEVWGEQAGCFLGSAAGTAGDVNGDGHADVVIGASDYSGSYEHEGRAYVYHGSAGGLEVTPSAEVSSSWTDAYFGGSAGTAGDVNGDGFADVIVGARIQSIEQLYEGRAYVYYGSPTGILGGGSPWYVEGEQFGAYLGTAVGTAGDVNGDGYADVVVGADGYDAGEVDEGRVYIYLGAADGLSYQPVWTAEGNQADAHLGLAVGTAGDVNGDGYADVIAGSGGYFSGGDPDKQRASLFYGNGNGGLAVRLRQRTPARNPVAPLGLTGMCNAVRLEMYQWMPLGRDWVRLQWQVAPLGTPFGAADGVVSGIGASWAETHSTGVTVHAPLWEVVSGLRAETAYHWRARLLYEPGNRLGLAAGPWRHVPWNGWSELDFRTGRCRVYLPLVTRGRQ